VQRKVLLISTPNSGKTLLFNRLTGLQQKVANFPGVTVSICSGTSKMIEDLEIIDCPGVYSLSPITQEEKISVSRFRQFLELGSLERVVCVLDATRLEQGLYFGLQVKQFCQTYHTPMLFVVNMIDILQKNNLQMDISGLQKECNVPVIALSARTGEGLSSLHNLLRFPPTQKEQPFLSERQEAFDAKEKNLPDHLSTAEDISEIKATPEREKNRWRQTAQAWAQQYGPQTDLLLRSQTRLDSFFLHSWWGGMIFFLIMYLLFQSIFSWAAPLMDGVRSGVAWLGTTVLPWLPAGWVRAFVKDAVFGGFGAFLVFVPQIFILTLMIGLLEDSGYLARAAILCHRPLRFFGLTGKSFVPMLSGVACAIPGIYAARTIDSPRKRWLTYFAIPLMPCAARLPVYALLIAAFIPAKTLLGGLVGWRGLVMFSLYLFGIGVALLITSVISRKVDKDHKDLPFVLEMPSYRWPSWGTLLRNAYQRSRHFVTQAGPVIFVVTLLIWVMGYFPNQGRDIGGSWLGSVGRGIEPLFAPLGLDWRYGIAILTSFAAREVFVGTLGTIHSISEPTTHLSPLAEKLQADGLGLASGVALVVFFALAMQCVSTLAILRKESGSWKLPTQIFVGYSVLAYAFALASFHLVRLLGG